MKPKEKKTYQVECGIVQGFYKARNEGDAFRAIMRTGKYYKTEWAELARFREVVLDKHYEIVKRGLWHYQDPKALYKVEANK